VSRPQAYLPDLLVSAGAVHAGAALNVQGGLVASVGAPPLGAERVPLPGLAILPGLVSAHGHAFQRAMRGRTQGRDPSGPSVPSPPAAADSRPTLRTGSRDFWSWRAAMYDVANRLEPDDVEAVARLAFHELARAGVTAVGEFHYLHNDPAGRPYADPAELARRVVRAARDVGLRIVLLRAAYARAGHGLAPDPAQRRFVEPSVDAYLAALERTESALRGDPFVSIGIAPHSVRACPEPWLAALAAEARRRRVPLHVHAAEQAGEVTACRAEHGLSPIGLLARTGALGRDTTLVHAIHVDAADVAAIGAAGATVCACPTTERDLGDGVVPADRLLAAGARLAVGADSLAQVDLLEDARALEQQLRLVTGTRGVLDDPPGALASRLLDVATRGGMAALGLAGGALAPGEPADFVAVDLSDPSLAGASAESLLPTVVFSLARTAIRHVHVAGERVIEERASAPGRVPADRLVADFTAVMRRLWGG
jgi:formimidoylglutamate deiminase